jgi:protein-S-isoprenylcysteine O-methyltransferase Ste14
VAAWPLAELDRVSDLGFSSWCRSNQDMNRNATGWLLVGIQVVLFVVLLLLPWRSPTAGSLVVGALLVGSGIALGAASMRTLGKALTPTPVPIEGAGLRTTGPYRLVRHPIYSALLLATLGLLIAVGGAWGWVWGLVIVGFFWAKSRWEDSLLRETYGNEWDEWAKRTGALIPRFRRSNRPS